MLAPVLTMASTMLIADHVDEDLLQAGADQRAGQAQDDAAVACRGASGRRCRPPGPGRGAEYAMYCIASTSGTTLCCLMSMCSMVRLRSSSRFGMALRPISAEGPGSETIREILVHWCCESSGSISPRQIAGERERKLPETALSLITRINLDASHPIRDTVQSKFPRAPR